jgi:hypothetical protein
MKSFANTIANARRMRAPVQSEASIALEQEKRKITQAEETATPTIAQTPTEKLGTAPVTETEGIVDRPKPEPSVMARAESMIEPAGSIQPVAREIAQRGITDISGQTTYNPAIATQAVQAEQTAQAEMAPAYVNNEDFFDYNSPDELQNRFDNATSSRDALTNVVATGYELREKLDETFRPTIDDNSDTALNVKSLLARNGLIDPTTNQLNSKVSNALVIQLIEEIQDHVNKRDDRLAGKYNTMQTNEGGSLFDLTEETSIKGELITPGYIRGNLSRGVIGKLVKAQNQTGQTVTGFGNAGTTIDPEAASYLDVLMWDAVKELGFLELITDGDQATYRMTEGAENFFNTSRELLADIQPDARIDVSSVPTIEGQSVPGQERLKGQKAGPVSIKSKMDENTVVESRTKNNLGRMPLRILEERFNFAMQVVASIIQIGEDGKTIIGLANQADEGFYSKEPWASMIGLDEAKWMKAYSRALKTHNNNREMAIQQADRVVRREAKKIFQTMLDGEQRRNKVFYNKWFHASSVGRYFVRNTILNYQDSKLVRNFVGNARRIPVNLNSSQDRSSRILKNWRYIIGKNLLTKDQTNGVKTEDMGWNAVQRISDSIINDPNNPTYQRWYDLGNKLREVANSDYTNIDGLNSIIGKEFLADFQDPAEWGYKFQSLVDFANYVDATKRAKENPNSPVIFEPLAQTQHDGKQNGIAIQAMQMGNIDLLKYVGLLYSNEDNVIPQGDIRNRFASFMPKQIKTTFVNSPEKIDLWSSVFDEISKHPDRKDIIKAISKTPLMEVSYGKDPSFNQDTVISILDHPEYGKIIEGAIKRSDLVNYDRIDQIEDFNSLITGTLTATLDTKHQKTLQEMGMLWSMLGKTPFYKGPLGTNIFLGSREFTDTGKTIPVPTAQGVVNLPLQVSRPTGSARSRSKTVFNKEEGVYQRSKPSRFGQEVANQLPVISVQQIDAAIMAKTINDINTSRKEAMFMLPVHDAIITDASSVDEYHQRINKNFIEINTNYNMANNVLNGYTEAVSNFKNRVNPNGSYLLSMEGDYRSMHTYILAELEKEQKKDARITAPITGRRKKKGKRSEFLAAVRSAGWKENGANVSGTQLKQIFDLIERYSNIVPDFRQWQKDSKIMRKVAISDILKRVPYTYN